MNRLLYLIWYRLGPSVLHACLWIFEYIVLSSQEINGDGIKTKHSYQYPLFKIESLVDGFLKLPLQNFVCISRYIGGGLDVRTIRGCSILGSFQLKFEHMGASMRISLNLVGHPLLPRCWAFCL